MKRNPRLFAVVVLGLLLAPPSFAAWYSGGTLHRATVAEWRRATYANKLATSADWAITRPGVRAKVMRSGSIENIRPYAVQMLTCVDAAAGPAGYGALGVSELAAACAISLGW